MTAIRLVFALTILSYVVLLGGCGAGQDGDDSEALTADSTCREYRASSAQAQHDAAVSLSSELSTLKPGDPEWETSLDVICSTNPSMALREAFPSGDAAGEGEENSVQASNAIDGSFAATPGNRYTLEVGYDIESLEAEVDIANAQPGEAVLNAIVSGQLTFTNTTPARNTVFGPLYQAPYIQLYWKQGQLPAASNCEEDGLEIDGTVHCYLLSVHSDIDAAINVGQGSIELEPDGRVSIPLTPSPLGGNAVPEQDAEALAELIGTTPPSLLLVDIDGLEVGYDCGLTGYTAAVTGRGKVLADSNEPISC